MSHVTRYIRARRKALGLTQKSVATSLGYRPQFVTNWERGTSQPPPHALPKLCRAPQVPARAMLELLAQDSAEFYRGVFSGRAR